MVQNVTIPLSWANEIIGVSEVEDVTFDVPDLDDIEDALDVDLPLSASFEEQLFGTLEGIEANIISEIPTPDEIGEEVVNQLTGLEDVTFPSPEEIAEAVVADIPEFDVPDVPSIDEIGAEVNRQLGFTEAQVFDIEVDGSLFDVSSDFVDLIEQALVNVDFTDVRGFPDLDSIGDVVEERVTKAIEALPDGDLLTDLDSVVDDQIDRLSEELVSEDTRELLQEDDQ